MTTTLYWVTCKYKDCSPNSILLPLPIRREKSPNRLLWPKDGNPRNILCLHCMHAYEYTRQDVQSGRGDIRGLNEEPAVDTMLRIEARCDETDCGFPVYILLPATIETERVFAPAEWFQRGKHGVVRCSRNHLTARIREGSVCLQRDPSFWQ